MIMFFQKKPSMNHSVFLLLFTALVYAPPTFSQNEAIEKTGDVLQIALPSAALASTIIWRDGQEGPWQFVYTMTVSTILTQSLKRAINKPRPNGGSFAFPSGHTSAAFTGAAFIQKRHGWKWGLPAYALAGFTGWSRVHANKHDYWDVLGGAVIGIGSAYLFAKPYQKHKMDLSLGMAGDFYQFQLNFQF
jgi:membrane-associated phospholipid phosphatase